ncbi:hypothetical protein ACFX2F_007197 [Malus domestica]
MAENNVPASSSTLPNNSFHPFSTVVNIKLDRTNYPLWLAQILPILKSRDLMGYVDGTLVCPPKNVTGATTLNPSYTAWVQQDQMILSWINGSLTASVLFVMASKRTARATWEALEQRYASTSQNRILFLRNELLQTKKGDLSVADYLDRMNAIADNLALAGHPVSDDELVQIVLNNLGPAFEMTVSAAQARDNPITYPTLEALLLTTERRMATKLSLWWKVLLSMPSLRLEVVVEAALLEMDEAPLHPPVVLKEATTHAIIIISAILQVILKDRLHMVIALFAKSAANLDIPLLTATTA